MERFNRCYFNGDSSSPPRIGHHHFATYISRKKLRASNRPNVRPKFHRDTNHGGNSVLFVESVDERDHFAFRTVIKFSKTATLDKSELCICGKFPKPNGSAVELCAFDLRLFAACMPLFRITPFSSSRVVARA